MALEYIGSSVSAVVEYTIVPIKRRIGHVLNYKSKVEDLELHYKKLRYSMERMHHSIDEAKRNGEDIQMDVIKWMTSANETALETEKFIADENQAKRCFIGLCPNLMKRYQFNKRAEKKIFAIVMLLDEGQFEKISYRPPLQLSLATSSDGSNSLHSRKIILEEVMGSLADPNINLIGVYGMGGVGKTTLAKEVCRQALERRQFDVAVMAVVSPEADYRRMQAQIADGLGLKFDEMTLLGRAARLSLRIKRETKILLVLDDIWQPINFEELGIPNHKGCKILLTTRNRDVLRRMGADINFALEVLREEEAMRLFETMVGDVNKDLELQPIATEVVKRCAGLPLLIVAVARSLRSKDLYAWKDAAEQLSRVEEPGIYHTVCLAVELSYHYLDGDEVKSVFLLCGLLRHKNIWIPDLLKYSIGLGLLKNTHTIDAARNRLHKLISDLKARCLLLDGTMNGFVTMHDVLQDVAVSIASKNGQVFMVRSESRPVEWPEDILKSCTGISLRSCDRLELPEKLECPKLEFLLLHAKDLSLSIPDFFFEGIQKLRVLDFSGISFSHLPASLVFLTNLRTLRLDHCILLDVCIIGELKNLEILTFVGSDIVELPREMAQLNRLKLLDLSHCSKLKVIPANVISWMVRLEELYVGNSFNGWEIEGLSDRGNASLAEVKSLPHLTALETHIQDANTIPKDLFSERLERFRILIGGEWDWDIGNYEVLRLLKLKLNTSIHLEHGLKMLLNRTEDLYLDEIKGIKSLLYDLNIEGFPQLKHLHVQNNSEVKHVVDSVKWVSYAAFPILQSLSLENLVNLKKICHGELAASSFSKLRSLKIKSCHKLKNLFAFNIIRGLLQLQEMEVTNCKNMEEIVADEDAHSSNVEYEAVEFSQFRSLALKGLPTLRSFCSIAKVPSTVHSRFKDIVEEDELSIPPPLFTVMVPNLEELKVSSIPCKRIWQSHSQFPTASSHLTSLIVHGCHNLKYVFTFSMAKCAPRLKKLEISDCELMNEIIATDEFAEEPGMSRLLFTDLEVLKLQNLPNVSSFCNACDLIECPSLRNLLIKKCPAMETLISNSIANNKATDEAKLEESHRSKTRSFFNEKVVLPNLEEMELSHISQVENIWLSQLAPDSFPKLKSIRIKYCENLRILFPFNALLAFRSLEKLGVIDCCCLEEIYQLQQFNGEGINEEAEFQLTELYLSGLHKLRTIWSNDPRGIFNFDNIHLIHVSHCQVLKHLFPASIARRLPLLKQLAIRSCGVEEIVAEEGDMGEIPRFVFPRLTSSELQNLPNLRSFYRGMHTLEWPVLKYLKFFGCDKVMKFSLEDASSQEDIPIQQSLFVAAKVFPNLEELSIDGKDMMMILEWQLPKKFFYMLKLLELRSFEEELPVSLFGFLGRLQNLEKIVLSDSSVKELFLCEGIDVAPEGLPRIRYLELNRLFDLKNKGKQDSQLLQNVEILKVQFCENLVNLVSSSASFHNLTYLEVCHCNELRKLVTSSVAKTMLNLEKLRVEECAMLTEIVGEEQEETYDEIVFSKLKTVALVGLRNLTSFCSAGHTFNFPSLKKVTLARCPKLRIFTHGILCTPNLERVLTEFPGDKRRRVESSLNATIEQMYAEMNA